MNKEDVIKLAIKHTINGLKFDEEGLLRFAKLVAEQEREACAKVCDEQMRGKSTWIKGAEASALAIRARGQA
jgi:hypothetical protein